MKYVVALVLGLISGACIFMAGLYYNPFVGQPSISPLSVTDDRVVDLSFSAVPADAILYTDHGESIVTPLPDRVGELWEPALSDTTLFVTRLEDSRGGTAGVGIKFSSHSEATRIMQGNALSNSAWHVYLRGQGTMLIDQTENYWAYLRDVVIPARMSSGDKLARILSPGHDQRSRVTRHRASQWRQWHPCRHNDGIDRVADGCRLFVGDRARVDGRQPDHRDTATGRFPGINRRSIDRGISRNSPGPSNTAPGIRRS